MAELSNKEQELFKYVKRTGDWDAFSERYFKLPMSGTWYTPEDRVEQYSAMYDVWSELGQPEEKFTVEIDSKPTELRVSWDSYYSGYPIFLLPHGFRTMPWMRQFLAPETTKAIAVTGTGSGKTAGCAIRALTYCALYPGYRFLNVAPGQAQADLALGEVSKWAANTEFKKFIRMSRGANPLWKEKPYPTITIDVVDGYPSMFTCQTVKGDATQVLGGERDWINADEAQLLEGIEESQEILATRLRGTRSTGAPRATKLTWITNPGHNPELMSLMDQYRDLQEKGDKSMLVLEGIDTKDNIYLTKRQREEQAKVLNKRSLERWHGGLMSAVLQNSEIGEEPLEQCFNQEMHDWCYNPENDQCKIVGGLGIMEYYRPPKAGHAYVVVGDTGKGNIASLNTQNVPAIMCFDVTHFLEKPMELAAFAWFDGDNNYETFTSKMLKMMARYGATGYYDAGNIQTAFEDMDERFARAPTTPVLFSGMGNQKRWAVAIAIQLMNDQQFRWPRIKAFWHQARIFEYASKRKADDIIAALLVFCLALRLEGTMWSRFVEVYKWDEEGFDDAGIKARKDREGVYVERLGRYDRFI